MVVVAHLADCNDRSRRSAVFSAFAVQETTLRLLGKGLFPFWDYLVIRLGIRGTLPRYRCVQV
jgi:arabinogalactan endo-1,4-beta-galactosidase